MNPFGGAGSPGCIALASECLRVFQQIGREQRAQLAQGDIRALLFASNPLSPHYFAELPLAETATIIAAASGPPGTNRDYLEQVAAQLLALQIRDDYIADLLRHIQRSDTHET